MDEERWEAITGAVANLVYCLALAALVLAAAPQVRQPALSAWRAQLHAWRLGRWLAARSRPPGWTRLLEREDLPAERP